MDERYLMPQKGGRWAISMRIGERCISLVENATLDASQDAECVLEHLGLERTEENLNRYFPVLSIAAGRCPNLDVLELCCLLEPSNPLRSLKERMRAAAAV